MTQSPRNSTLTRAGHPGWPRHGGEMAALIRARDWAATPLGPGESWPQSLRTAIDLCLACGFASYVWWGRDLVQFYNDAALPVMRSKHPAAFGAPARQAWAEVWPVVGPLVERVLASGEAALGEDLPMVPDRGGAPEAAYFTFSYSALRDEAGAVAGLFITAIETTAKVQAEAARRESERSLAEAIEPAGLASGFRAMFEAAPVPMLVVLPGDLRIVAVNDAYLAATMTRRADILGQALFDMFPDDPEDPAATGMRNLGASLRRVLATSRPDTMPTQRYPIRRPAEQGGGFEERWWDPVNSPVLDPDGRVSLIVHSVVDVTARIKAEEAMRQSDRHFRLMADAVPQIVWITDSQGGVEFFNRQWTLYTGKACEPSTATEIAATLVHPDDGASTMEAFDEARRTRSTFQVEHRIRSATGEYRWFLVRAEPFFDPGSGEIVRWFGTSTDIHDRKRAEEGLVRREREFRTLADNTPAVLLRYDRELRALFANRALEVAIGRKPQEFLGKTCDEAGLPPAFCDLWSSAIRAVFEHRQPRSIEFQLDTPKGLRHFTGQLVPESGPGDEVESVLGVVSDWTREKLALDALRESDRRKDEFLATLAHELRNPLAPLSTGLQILRFAPPGAAAAAKTLEMMERQLSHTVRLIDDLLDVSRISCGKLALRRERVTLRSVLDTAIEASHPFIERGDHELVLRLPDKSLCLDGDPTRLAQVIGNLLNNAAKYTPNGGRIELSAQSEGNEAVIRVKDNGVGIAPDLLPELFEMFVQAPGNAGHSQGGLGIGLSLVRRLVEMHHGAVRADSAGPGQGAVFTVRLPLAGPQGPVQGPGAAGPVSGANALRILVVDDNVDAAESLALMLGLLGHDARTAHDGAKALAMARQSGPFLVFCDLGMPGMDGYEVARRFRSDPVLSRALLVALSGWGSEEDKRRASEAGFDAHLTKPVDLAAMQQLLVELSQSRRAGASPHPGAPPRVS